MAIPKRSTHAVCPRIERNGNIRTPKLFRSESAARLFLNSEVRFPLEPEAEVAGATVEEVRARRAERKARLKQEREQVASRIKSGELHPLAYPHHLQPILNRHQGWQDLVPVRGVVDRPGPKCNRTMRDFLPVAAVGTMPEFNLEEEIERALEGRSADYTCYLDDDWRFDEIEADAWRRGGYEYSGRRHGGIAEIIVKAVHDLEAALLRVHSNVPCHAVADFWSSWQVQRHIAEFCSRLADSDTARLLAGKALDATDQAERSRMLCIPAACQLRT